MISAIVVAKKTGDYSILSHTDLCVVALTYELDAEEKEKSEDSQVSIIGLILGICAEWRTGRTGSRN